MRLINANKLLEWRHTFASDFGRRCAEMFISAIDQEETIEIPKWIPVSERLPEDGEKVVVTLEDGDARTMTFYRSNNDWWFETDEGWEYKAMARAWMPSYKESEEV